MAKHEPERTCIVCRKKSTKDNFFKIIVNKNGEISVCADSHACGRGLYICKDGSCIDNLIKQKSLSKVLKRNVPQEVYEEIYGQLKLKQN